MGYSTEVIYRGADGYSDFGDAVTQQGEDGREVMMQRSKVDSAFINRKSPFSQCICINT